MKTKPVDQQLALPLDTSKAEVSSNEAEIGSTNVINFAEVLSLHDDCLKAEAIRRILSMKDSVQEG